MILEVTRVGDEVLVKTSGGEVVPASREARRLIGPVALRSSKGSLESGWSEYVFRKRTREEQLDGPGRFDD